MYNSYILMVKAMKKVIKTGIKIYLFLVMIISIFVISYAFYLNKTNSDYNIIFKVALTFGIFFTIGFSYTNAIRKKLLLLCSFIAIVHYLLYKITILLAINSFNFEWIMFLIAVNSAIIGGMVGISQKKIF